MVWRVVRALVVAILAVMFSAYPAAAGAKWCEDDPLIQVNGLTAHVTVGFSADNLSHLSGKVTYYVVVAQSYLATTTVDSTMATLPTETFVYALPDAQMQTWKGDKIKVIVFARVPAKKSFQTATTVTDFNQRVIEQKHGRSNDWIEVDFNLS